MATDIGREYRNRQDANDRTRGMVLRYYRRLREEGMTVGEAGYVLQAIAVYSSWPVRVWARRYGTMAVTRWGKVN